MFSALNWFLLSVCATYMNYRVNPNYHVGK